MFEKLIVYLSSLKNSGFTRVTDIRKRKDFKDKTEQTQLWHS